MPYDTNKRSAISAQNDVLQNNESAILTAGNNITLNSTAGNIGADGNAMRVDANGKVNISANGSDYGKGNVWLTSADKNLTLGTASVSKDLNVTTTGSNASIITDGAIAAGNINLNSANNVTVGNTLSSTGNTTITSVSDTTINGAVSSGGTTSIDANTVALNDTGSIAATGKAEIISDNDVNIEGAVTTDADAFISGNKITISSAVTAATGAVIEAVGDVILNDILSVTEGNVSITSDGSISQDTNLQKSIHASGTIGLTAANSIGSQATPLKIAAGEAVSAGKAILSPEEENSGKWRIYYPEKYSTDDLYLRLVINTSDDTIAGALVYGNEGISRTWLSLLQKSQGKPCPQEWL